MPRVIVNHDTAILVINDFRLLPGINRLPEEVIDRIASSETFQEYEKEGRLEICKVRGKITDDDVIRSMEEETENFAMAELGHQTEEVRKQMVKELPDVLAVQYHLARRGGMGETEAIVYVAGLFGLEPDEVRERVNG